MYSPVHSLLEAGRLSLRAEPGGLSLMPLVLLAEEAEGPSLMPPGLQLLQQACC